MPWPSTSMCATSCSASSGRRSGVGVRQRELGPGAPAVSAVGYGGHASLDRGRPPEAQGIRVLHAALDAGVTLIDTADVYCLDQHDIGHNERLIAAALTAWPGDRARRHRGHQRRRGPARRPLGERRHARRIFAPPATARSLALGVERIDLYQLHAPDPGVPLADSVGALARLQRGGQVRWVGLSNVSGGPDPGGAGHRADHHGPEPAESVLSGSTGGRRRAILRRAGNRVSGLQPHRRRAAQPQAAGAPGALARIAAAHWARRPTRWCWPGCWRSRQP